MILAFFIGTSISLFLILCAKEAKIKELESNKPEWISFKDKERRPKLYQNILVNVPGAEQARMDPVRSIFWCPARVDELEHDMLFYTHWQPAPQQPKENEK